MNQQTYLRALRTIPNLEIIYGHFLSHVITMPVANCPPGKQEFVEVIKTEEKGSDVNLGTHLLGDAYDKRYELAIVVTNDSDLAQPVQWVTEKCGLPVGIFNPFKGKTSKVLSKHATFTKTIQPRALKRSQFPAKLKDDKGTFRKPKGW